MGSQSQPLQQECPNLVTPKPSQFFREVSSGPTTCQLLKDLSVLRSQPTPHQRHLSGRNTDLSISLFMTSYMDRHLLLHKTSPIPTHTDLFTLISMESAGTGYRIQDTGYIAWGLCVFA